MREIVADMRECYGNNHINLGHKRTRAFSPLWWIVRATQYVVGAVGLWLFYVLSWIMLV